ncbi:sulfotransferase [Iamia sp. SCSIO 61187]|uniref:sulfotransferase family protein n=1 Tax=Iamia sp. SCSIO 61187 TaxID=2722752 RepID=UPI001C624D1B|nr:sulfotransferase [Iamia sp. SCSIO 61187]QYG95101.1 sulfotransferase [Iamia sp. SCSIO 61187]
MGIRAMGERYSRPDWVRRMNAMGEAVGGAARMVPLVADHLLEHTRLTTGIDDPGDLGDGDWEGRLRALVDAVNGSALHVVGRMLTREELMRSLRTRFLVGERWRRDPSIADEVIEAPIVVTGPARSGTTILFELLGLDPGLRTPIATDVIHPVVPPGTSAEQVTAMTECEQELWADVQPEMASVHELRSDLPVECITLCAPSFAGSHWPMLLTDLGDWVPDVAMDLAWHRVVLQTVQHGRPPQRWLLKTPGYLMMLDDLLAAYPDACIVMTHRDPAKTMPSTVSTVAMVQWLRTDHVELDVVAPLIGALFADALTTVGRRRLDGSLGAPFGDVRFAELMADPVAAVAGAYAGIGRELTAEHAAAIEAYLRDKPRGKHGTHRYTAEEWGFDAEVLHRDLAEYMAQFDVEPEA